MGYFWKNIRSRWHSLSFPFNVLCLGLSKFCLENYSILQGVLCFTLLVERKVSVPFSDCLNQDSLFVPFYLISVRKPKFDENSWRRNHNFDIFQVDFWSANISCLWLIQVLDADLQINCLRSVRYLKLSQFSFFFSSLSLRSLSLMLA